MSANTETTGGPPKGYFLCPDCKTTWAGIGLSCWGCRLKINPRRQFSEADTFKAYPDWTPPIAAPAAHVERRKGQTWEYQFQDDEPLYPVVLTERCEPNAWATEKHGMIFDAAWSDPNVRMSLLADAPPEPAMGVPHPKGCRCKQCEQPIQMKSPPAQEAPKAAPVCGNNDCKTPHQNVAQRWCASTDGRPAEPEWSCEPCHLLDEKDFTMPTKHAPYAGPERLPKPQLAADWVEDCLPGGGR